MQRRLGELDPRRDLGTVLGEDLGQPVDAVHHGRAFPGQVVEPDVPEAHLLRQDAEPAGEIRWKPIATLQSPTARCPASSRARVTMPTGLVKSMIHASLAALARARSAMSSTTGTVRSALARPPRRSSPGPRSRSPAARSRRGPWRPARRRGAAARRPRPRRARRRCPWSSAQGRVPVGAHDPGGEGADYSQPRLVRVDQYQLGDLDLVGQPGDSVDELRGVGGASADNSEFHPNALTSVLDWAT